MPKNTPTFPYFVAEFIESHENGSMKEAIRFIAGEELRGLKSQLLGHSLRLLMEQVSKVEMEVLSFLEPQHEQGELIFLSNNQGQKDLLVVLKEKLIFLYKTRRGSQEGKRLEELIAGNQSTPFEFRIEYATNQEGRKYIKRLSLKNILPRVKEEGTPEQKNHQTSQRRFA